MAMERSACSSREVLAMKHSPLSHIHCELEDGLAVNLLRYRSSSQKVERSINPHGQPVLALTFGIQGESYFQEDNGRRIPFRAGCTTVAGFSASRGERCLPAGQVITQLRILLDEQRLRYYVDGEWVAKWLVNEGVNCLSFSVTTGVCHAHVRALACQLQQDFSRLDMHVHALSALAHTLRTLLPDRRKNVRLSQARIEQLERARSLLLERLDCSPSLTDLSTEVGLNEFALKQGFRQLFGTTPRLFLHESRMSKAHALLETGCQVGQVAYQVGYSHPGNFSVAFLRYYGYYPKDVFDRRR